MSNQVILWGSLVVPWLTLFFMPKEDIKRYLPAGLVATLLCIVVTEVGITKGWWLIRETTYPLAVMPTYTYGAYPVAAMWSLKFTYGRVWLFVAAEIVMNNVLAFIIYPWLARKGIKDFDADDAGYIVFIFASVIAVIVYVFQMWQDGVFARSERTSFSGNLQPAASKPLSQENNDKANNEK
ncbi:hypothetical protein [Sporomusa malonica]|uniref:Uncharacterized protein n=1 Tax=Sporomusa malonica TaxID=112901 RepID=A0A1W2CNA2_9FIRM|nr:hypothetical protein [Sporomusa malonica]SMC86699.1 hypothetical protein SAMN04488500_11137 [Sporomusa malonica]